MLLIVLFFQTAVSDSEDLCIVLEIRAQVEDVTTVPDDPPSADTTALITEDAVTGAANEDAVVVSAVAVGDGDDVGDVGDVGDGAIVAVAVVGDDGEMDTTENTTMEAAVEGGEAAVVINKVEFIPEPAPETIDEPVGIINPETGFIEPVQQVKKERKRRRVTMPGEVPLNHENKAYCEECDWTFRENRNYFKHMLQHDGLKTYTCPFCKKGFDLKRIVLNHVLELHCRIGGGGNKPKAQEAGEDDGGEKAPKDLEEADKEAPAGEVEEEETGYECGWCGLKSKTMTDSFKNHVRHHMAEKHECEFCDRQFFTKVMLEEHLELKHRGPPYKCSKCVIQGEDGEENMREFHTKEEFKKHNRNEHKPVFVCRVCGDQFNVRKAHQNHLRQHTAEDLCASGVKSKAVADIVKDVVEQEKREKRLAKEEKQQQVRARRDRETNLVEVIEPGDDAKVLVDVTDPSCRLRIKTHYCKYCSRGFTKAEVLRRHEARHLGENVTYKCRFCETSFGSQKMARQHELDAHCKKEDGTYACQWCQKTFKEPIKLRSHEWLHTKESEYQCQYCDRRCKSKSIRFL